MKNYSEPQFILVRQADANKIFFVASSASDAHVAKAILNIPVGTME